MVLPELLDSNCDFPAATEVMYSVRRKKDTPETLDVGLPRAFGPRIRGRSRGWIGGGSSIAEISGPESASSLNKVKEAPTVFNAVENTWDTNKINGHAELCIAFDIQRLLAGQP